MAGRRRELRVINEPSLGRREVLGGLISGFGAAAAVPALAAESGAAHSSHHPADPQAPLDPPARGVFDLHQRETFAILAARIVPSSSSTNPAVFVESLLSQEGRAVQAQFFSALGSIDAEARRRFGQPFRAISAARQDEVLTAASTGARGLPDWRWRIDQPVPAVEADDARVTLRDQFEYLKAWSALAYYSSETGQRELGWTGRAFYSEYHGCPHPPGHHG
jgi:Gluconate 2-dehydrogenase subunit 3